MTRLRRAGLRARLAAALAAVAIGSVALATILSNAGVSSRLDESAQQRLRDSAVIGLSGDELPHVFERFWRSDKSRSRSRGGAGIGLAIVRELVRAHDGRIDVTSHPGEGTTFSIWIPALRPDAATRG